MAMYQLYMMISGFAVFLLCFYAVFLATARRGQRRQNLLLAAFFVATAMSNMDSVFIHLNTHFHASFRHVVHATMSFDYAMGPLLLLYACARLHSDFKLKPIHALHFLVFGLHLCYLLVRYSLADSEGRHSPDGTVWVFSKTEVQALTTISTLHLLTYIGWIAHVLGRKRKEIKQVDSSGAARSYNWLLILSAGFGCAALMRFFNNLLWLQTPDAAILQVFDFKLVSISGTFLCASWVLLKSLNEPDLLLAKIDSKVLEIKQRPSLLPDSTRAQYVDIIREYMLEHKPHLDSKLSLGQLADALQMSSHHLSHVINAEFEQNFFDFINHHRIEEAKRMLEEAEQDRTITEVMFDAGFNSKSVFNTCFKRRTGLTPSQYRSRCTLPDTA
jgi:AraC-like DNA-binding protein/cbb3-type cytochrome oxidase subunit 3